MGGIALRICSLIHRYIKRAVIQATIIVVIAFIIGYLLTGSNLRVTIINLNILTLIISMAAILGKILGALYPSYGLARASIIAPRIARYFHNAARQAVDDTVSSWIILFISIALAYILFLVLKNLLAPIFEDTIALTPLS